MFWLLLKCQMDNSLDPVFLHWKVSEPRLPGPLLRHLTPPPSGARVTSLPCAAAAARPIPAPAQQWGGAVRRRWSQPRQPQPWGGAERLLRGPARWWGGEKAFPIQSNSQGQKGGLDHALEDWQAEKWLPRGRHMGEKWLKERRTEGEGGEESNS